MSELERAMSIVDRALMRPRGEREAFIRAECRDVESLRILVEGIMISSEAGVPSSDAHAAPIEAGSAGTPPPPSNPQSPFPASPPSMPRRDPGGEFDNLHDPPPDIGPRYRLGRKLGEGGFGTVYMAEQIEPVHRSVAVKVINPGRDTRTVLARFDRERQALAVMDHPNVARVFDGGMSRAGRPYFVMEYVPGERITEFCDRRQLPIRERLRLFISVCDAVQHAHQKGIVHRDITPGNVLVCEDEPSTASGAHAPSRSRARPRVKVIDFGMAKALDDGMLGDGSISIEGQVIGTPEYMSPEQAAGSGDIDALTDVYSLGVLLYRLVSGRVPFQPRDRSRGAIEELGRRIQSEDPPRPSTAAGPEAPASIKRELRDLEPIPLKAMRRDRKERYVSPAALAEDVQRYLDSRPLEAEPDSRIGQARKFVRRNRGAVTAAALVFAALAAGFGTALLQMNRALDQERKAADNAAREAKARERSDTINQFVTAWLNSADPTTGGAQDATILRAMQRAVVEIDAGRFRNDPELEATLKDTIATVLDNNGNSAEAERLCTEALETRRRIFPGDHPAVAASLNNLGAVRQSLSKFPEAEAAYAESLEMYRRLDHGDSTNVATGLNNVAVVRQLLGRPADAEDLFVQALDMRQRLFPGDSVEVAQSLYGLGRVRHELGRDGEAAPLYEQALAMRQRLFPNGHPDVAQSLTGVADLHLAAGRVNQAEPLYEQALVMRRALFKGDHPDVAMALNNLALIRERLGRSADAEPLMAEALAMHQRLSRGDHQDIARDMNNLASVRESLGRAAEAEPMYEQALAMQRRLFPGDHDAVATAINNLANARLSLGRPADALPLFVEALEMRRRLYAGDHPDVATSLNNVASCLKALGRAGEGEPLLVEALDMFRRLYSGDHPLVASALSNLGDSRQAQGRPADAEPLLVQALQMRQRLFKRDHPSVATSLNNLGEVRRMLGRSEEAEELIIEALDMRKRLFKGDHPAIALSLTSLAVVRQSLDQREEARAAFDEAIAMQRRLTPGGGTALARVLWRSGVAWLANNEPASARPQLEEAVGIGVRYLPADHPHLKEYRDSLDACTAALQ